jgi:hypothetical protein
MTAQSAQILQDPPRKTLFRKSLQDWLLGLGPTSPKAVLARTLRGRALIGVYLDDDGVHLNLLTLTNGRRRAVWRVHLETMEFVVEEPQPDETWLIFNQSRMKIARFHLEKDLFSIESAGQAPLFVYAKRSRKGFWHLYFS